MPLGVAEREIPGPAGEFRVRLYFARGAARNGWRRAGDRLYHGGGHVVGSLIRMI